ncbi:tyrosine-type recombinase/integrase [Bifidobacterium imperatoris]|uniref:Integrase n=1 Tax=Bifidobacterium imperatoris TaxID=2020965 RepID=A0A2N5IQN3_9BIFI|nr:site-specific integrase [Bifidobacterium imperatoris]PLS24263.1 integrase [Bifidobacterium imperatoris]QSY56897.1 tyrosine-type recombinase/integrase [Bifidobacterium imperatoris]
MTTGVYSYKAKKFPGGIGWMVKYTDNQHRQRVKRGFRLKRDAEAFLAEIRSSLNNGSYRDPDSGRVTIGELGEAWLLGRKGVVAPSSYVKDAGVWKNWVLPKWRLARVSEIRRSDVQQWVSEISESVGAKQVGYALGVLRQICESAVYDRRIPSNPCKGVRVPVPHTEKRRVYLEMPQLEALSAEADRRRNKYGTLVLFMGLTGLRIGEATALRVGDVDLKNHRIRVRENAVWTGGGLEVGALKNHEERTVPFPPNRLQERLRERMEGKDHDALVFERPGAVNDGGSLSQDDYMRHPDSRTGWFTTSVRLTDGVPDWMTLHDLRHTAVSLAIHMQVSPKLVQRVAGHKTFSQTMETYADLYDSDMEESARKMDADGE